MLEEEWSEPGGSVAEHPVIRSTRVVGPELKQLTSAARGLLVLATIFALQAGAPVLIPVAFGFLLYLLVSPPHAALKHLGVPGGLAAFALVVTLIAPLAAALFALSEPAAEWLEEAPTSLADIGSDFRELSRPLETVKDASAAVTDAVDDITGTDNSAQAVVTMREPGPMETVLRVVPGVLATFGIGLAVTFLLLLDNDRVLTVAFARSVKWREMRRARVAVQQIKTDVSQYLGTIVLINMLLGVTAALAFTLLGLPNPWLWGMVAGLLNFAPYLGAAVSACLLVVAGVAEFDSLGSALAPAAAFVVLTLVEGQVITPIMLGRRLASSPVLILLAVLGFAAIWGVAGALMAVPLFFTARAWWRLTLTQQTTVAHSPDRATEFSPELPT